MPARRPTTVEPLRPQPEHVETGAQAPPAARKPGRPRSDECCQAIRGAALSLLVEHGFADVTIESIASRAGVGKATVYRRWPSKADLIVHAFFETVTPRVRIVDSGDLRADFRQQMRLVVREMAGPNGRALATLIGCMQMDSALAEAFRTRWLAVRRSEGRMALERGIERGALPRGTDPTLVLDALYSPLHFRLLAGHGPLTAQYSDQIVDLVFDGLEAKQTARSVGARASRSRTADAPRGKRSTRRPGAR